MRSAEWPCKLIASSQPHPSYPHILPLTSAKLNKQTRTKQAQTRTKEHPVPTLTPLGQPLAHTCFQMKAQ